MSAVHDGRRTIQHDGIFYDDEDILVSAALAFVREGIAADEVVMVNTGSHFVTPLLRAVFAGDEQVVFAERPHYSNPAAALDSYRRVMEKGLREGVRGYRAMGFIDFADSILPWQEWVRYEAAVNEVFADLPFRTLCPYDTSRLPSVIIEPMKRARSGLVAGDGRHDNPDYVPPAALMGRDELRTPPLAVQGSAPRMVLEPGEELMELRMEVYAATMFTDLPRRKVDDFVAAVGQVVANAHEHGKPPVRLRLWAADTQVVCTVTDQGHGIDDPLLGWARPRRPEQGIGLWASRQLVDVLDYDLADDGFTVRVAAFA
ncbi:MAG: anti-sigma factor RsbA family regulatory protein [Actinomycetota bacterium]